MNEVLTSAIRQAEIEFKLADGWRKNGRNARAISGYRKAIVSYSGYIPAYIELADLLYANGEFDEAIAVYRDAIGLNPKEVDLPYRLSKLLSENARRTALLPVATHRPHSVELPPSHQPRQILFYSDRPGFMGAEQINHLLMCGLATFGYRMTCAQYKASHYLIAERETIGIRHVWVATDDVYDVENKPRSLNDYIEPQNLLTTVEPDLVIFGDGCPLSSLTAKLVAARMGVPYIALVHCVTPAWAQHFAPYLENLAAAYESAASVIAVSQDNLDLLHQRFGLPAQKGQVIYNGRPAAYFATAEPTSRQELRRQLGIPSEAIVCFTSARMDFVKGYQHQIEAIQQLLQSDIWSRLYFVWAGGGSIESRIRAMALRVNHSDGHIKFLGERVDVPDLLSIADMFILPSYFEGMPLSIMEAMAKGVPVMATAVSGVPEELGPTGKLLPNPEFNPGATVKEMVATIHLWAKDDKLRQTIGRQCKDRAEEHFRAERMVAQYSRAVDSALISSSSAKIVTEALS